MFKVLAGYKDKWITVKSGFKTREEANEWLSNQFEYAGDREKEILLMDMGYHVEEVQHEKSNA